MLRPRSASPRNHCMASRKSDTNCSLRLSPSPRATMAPAPTRPRNVLADLASTA
ncbi:Uncharacterised protein [Bordetella pertussis]|nr:Uncharacterised protein [Bordetella pertussis]CFP65440.1 Uncharacterised protein [Bordetella pertussis]